MNPPEAFVRDLETLDPKLRARFATEPAPGNLPTERWVIERYSDRRGQWIEVLRVMEEDGGFRPLDNRVIHRLHEMDTWAHGGAHWGSWNSYARRVFMNKHGLRESAADAYMEPWKRAAERRYFEQAERLAEEFMHVMKKDPNYATLKAEDEKRVRQAIDDQEEVKRARTLGKGVLEKHPTFGHVRVRPGTLS